MVRVLIVTLGKSETYKEVVRVLVLTIVTLGKSETYKETIKEKSTIVLVLTRTSTSMKFADVVRSGAVTQSIAASHRSGTSRRVSYVVITGEGGRVYAGSFPRNVRSWRPLLSAVAHRPRMRDELEASRLRLPPTETGYGTAHAMHALIF